MESSSSSDPTVVAGRKRTTIAESTNLPSMAGVGAYTEIAEVIGEWAEERGLRRLRSDRTIGRPDEEQVVQWSRMLEQHGVSAKQDIFAVLDSAFAAANRSEEWRNWTFLTLQVQLAAERFRPASCESVMPLLSAIDLTEEDPNCDWAKAKEIIRRRIGEIPFANWFDRTRQVARKNGLVAVRVPDEPSRVFIGAEYGKVTKAVLAEFGIERIELIAEHGAQEPGTTHG